MSGLRKEDDAFVTSGGRVILALGKGATIEDAQKVAYNNVEKLRVITYFIVMILEIRH